MFVLKSWNFCYCWHWFAVCSLHCIHIRTFINPSIQPYPNAVCNWVMFYICPPPPPFPSAIFYYSFYSQPCTSHRRRRRRRCRRTSSNLQTHIHREIECKSAYTRIHKNTILFLFLLSTFFRFPCSLAPFPTRSLIFYFFFHIQPNWTRTIITTTRIHSCFS